MKNSILIILIALMAILGSNVLITDTSGDPQQPGPPGLPGVFLGSPGPPTEITGPSACPSNDCLFDAYKCGDVDGDGKVNVIDAGFLNQYLLGGYELNACQAQAGDVNNDGNITGIEPYLIVYCSLGTIGILDCGYSKYVCNVDDPRWSP